MRSGCVNDAAAPQAKDALLQPGRNCWRAARADRAAIIVDAADYYKMALRALTEARFQVILIGWDIDTRVRLGEKKVENGAPTILGPLLSWLTKNRPELDIYILAWDEGLISVPGRGTTMFRMLRWWVDPRITMKWDHSHPLDASHHQKILIIDDAIAFCGGIDITGSRWDTRHHRDKEPGRRRPFTRRSYEPWHDATMAVDADAAKVLGDLGRLRWKIARGEELPVPPQTDRDLWPRELKPRFRQVNVAIARTRGKEGDVSEVREVEALFVDMINAAERFVYIETQYFASRVIAAAIAKRLEEPDGPEFVVVNPRTAYGWLDEAVMSPARYQLMKALEARDRHGRFRIYTPLTEAGADIYVHAKIMIVDDRMLRVGSANMNNRSMGLDSECDVLIDGRDQAEARQSIADVRTDLLAEHLGVESERVADCFASTGSLIRTIETLRGSGRTLKPFDPEPPAKLKLKLAESELLDPEAADEMFEKRARPGLLSRLGKGRRGKGGKSR